MEKPVWDYESAMKRVMKKEKLLVRLAGLFIDDMPKRIEELKSAIEEENIESIRLTAHTIKGISANLSGLRLQELASELEAAAKQSDIQQVKQLVPSVIAANEEFTEVLRKHVASL